MQADLRRADLSLCVCETGKLDPCILKLSSTTVQGTSLGLKSTGLNPGAEKSRSQLIAYGNPIFHHRLISTQF